MNKQTARLLEQHFDTAFAAPDGIARLRELILTLAMQGKLVEQDPNDPPASELLKEIEAEKQRLSSSSSPRRRGSRGVRGLDSRLRGNDGMDIKPEEVPYELPQRWEWVRLGNVGVIGSSSRVHQRDWKTEGIPFYRAREIVKLSNAGFVENELFISQEHYQSLAKDGLTPEADDLMITGVGTIGVPYIVKKTDRFYFKDASVLIFKNIHRLCAQFLCRFFKSPFWVERIHDGSMGTTVHTLTIGRANEILLPLPPLPEQHRIVARIDQLMARCDELEKLRKQREEKRLAVHAAAIKQLLDIPVSPAQPLSSPPRRRGPSPSDFLDSRLRGNDMGESGNAWKFIQQHFGELYSVKENVTELRKAILQLAVMGRLAPQDPNDPPANELLKEIEAEKQRLVKAGKIKKPKPLPPIKPGEVPYKLPQGWEWVRLNDALDVRDGTHDTPKYVDVGYPLVTSKNIYTGSLSLEDVKYISKEDHEKIAERSHVDRGDILFAMIGSIGNPVIVECDIEFSIKNVALFKYFMAGKPNNRYLHYFLVYAQENMKAISSGAVQSFVSLGFLRNYPFPLPPLPEQHRIVAKIEQLMALCDTLDQQIDAATDKQTELFNAVMAQV